MEVLGLGVLWSAGSGSADEQGGMGMRVARRWLIAVSVLVSVGVLGSGLVSAGAVTVPARAAGAAERVADSAAELPVLASEPDAGDEGLVVPEGSFVDLPPAGGVVDPTLPSYDTSSVERVREVVEAR
jgi:hypothetical protein